MAEVTGQTSEQATPEQLIYASILEKGMYIGLLMLFITYALYIFGIMDPYIAMEELPKYWSMTVHDYLQEANVKPGWAWLSMLGHGDFINFIGVAVLAGITIICYIAIVPPLLKQGDKVYAVIAILEVIVLSLAASGLLASGH